MSEAGRRAGEGDVSAPVLQLGGITVCAPQDFSCSSA